MAHGLGQRPGRVDAYVDALVILESKDQPDCLTMCTHYAAVLTQCYLAVWAGTHGTASSTTTVFPRFG